MKTLLWAWLVWGISLATAADTVAGTYELQGAREMASGLLLKPDGTFEFMLAYGAADYEGKGTWVKHGGEVLLTSSGAVKPPFRLLRSLKTNREGERVMIKGTNGGPVENLDVLAVTANGELEARTDAKGVAEFPPAVLRSAKILVRVYDLEAGPYPLNEQHNEYEFEINAEAITQVRFEQERLKINRDSLEMRHWGPDKPMVYRKQSNPGPGLRR